MVLPLQQQLSVFICLIEHGTSGAENYHSSVQRKRLIRAVACFLFIKPSGEACDYGGIDSTERNGLILSEELEPVKGRRIHRAGLYFFFRCAECSPIRKSIISSNRFFRHFSLGLFNMTFEVGNREPIEQNKFVCFGAYLVKHLAKLFSGFNGGIRFGEQCFVFFQ